MTLTDEPGLYLAGKFGVRIENTVLIQDYKETEFGKFLQIESSNALSNRHGLR